MVVTKIQNDDEVKALERESPGHLMVLLFFAPWCGSSVKAVKNFSELSTKYEDVTFAEVDCDEAEAALTNGVKALPCFRFLRAGEEVGILEGAVPSTLEQMIISHRRETPPPAPRGPGRPRGGAAASRDHGR